MAKVLLLVFLLLSGCATPSQTSETGKQDDHLPNNYKTGKVLAQDDFSGGLDQWVVEGPANEKSRITTQSGKLVIDVNGGATVWLKQKLSGNYLIEYDRTVVVEGGPNDRLSDLNQFWMANDPRSPNLFTRSGVFSEYDSLLMYYVGVGGNTNKTTRFRKYTGNGERVLHQEYTDPAHLLQANKTYHIRTTVYNGLTQFYVDGDLYFSFSDSDPIRDGYFGFRTTQSRHTIDNFRVRELK